MRKLTSFLSAVTAARLLARNWLAVVAVVGMLCVTVAAWNGPSLNAPAAPQFTLKPIPFSALHHSWQPPRIRNANGTSSNWSGYAVLPIQTSAKKNGKPASASTFSDVTGAWVVPSVVAGASADTYSSSWIGIDGYSTNTVEQIGTEQDWAGGAPVYYAWFEMYPKGAYEIVGFPVNPGDTISAEVQSGAKGAFTLTLTNETAGVTFSTTLRSQPAQRLSAEWIEEAPSWGGVLPLADFGTIDFLNCYATMNGHTGPVSDTHWQFDPITMEASDGTPKAEPSALSAGGADFSVTWANE